MSAQKFWDRVADRYAKRPVSDEASYAATLELARSYLPDGAHVLELGCGTGSTALRLAGDVGQYLGTDISPRMIEIAAQKAATVDHIRFQAAQAHEDVGGPFDAILAFNLLHLLDNVPEVLTQAHKALRSGGIVMTKSGIMGEGLKHFLRLPLAVMRLFGKAPPVAFHSRAQLDRMFVDAGFEILHTEMLPAGSINRVIVARKP